MVKNSIIIVLVMVVVVLGNEVRIEKSRDELDCMRTGKSAPTVCTPDPGVQAELEQRRKAMKEISDLAKTALAGAKGERK